MGQRRTIQIPLTKGIDERISKKILPDGTLSRLHNSRIDKLGKVVRRTGWPVLFTDGISETDPYAASKVVSPLGITEADGSLHVLTTRRRYRLAPGEISWTPMGPADGRPAATTPIETLDVPIATWAVGGNIAGTTRKGTAESHCAAIVCDPNGNVAGSYVLLASRSIAYDESASDEHQRGLGHVQLTGYRTWTDEFGIRHWEQCFTKSYTADPARQLRVWCIGDSIYAGWFAYPVEDGWLLNVTRWTPRVDPFAPPPATIELDDHYDDPILDWDVAVPETPYEVSGHKLFLIAMLLGEHVVRARVMREDGTSYAVALLKNDGEWRARKIACCWSQSSGQHLFVFATDARSSTSNQRCGWLTDPDLSPVSDITWGTGTTTEVTEQMVAHHSLIDGGTVVVWTIDANSTTAPELRYWHAVAHRFDQVLGTFLSSGISLAPGKLASKVFTWDGRDVAWWLTVPPEPTTIDVSAVETLADLSLAEPPVSIDGVTLTDGMLVLLVAQSPGTQNGVYRYVSATAELVRPSSFPTAGNAKEILVRAVGGASWSDTLWYETASPAVVDTHVLAYLSDGTIGGLQDYSDRHYVLALTEPDFGNFTPLAIVSPHQAAEFGDAFGGSDYTTLGVAWRCDHALWQPTDWFWANIEAIRGNTEQYPEMAPRIHVWGELDVMRCPLEVKERMVFAAQGLAHCYGDSGAEELAIINGPGPIAVRGIVGIGVPPGAYSYRAVYRMVRHDGSTIRSIPSPSSLLVVGSGIGVVWIAVRTPRLSVLTDESGSLLSIYADIYRTEEGPGANWHQVGSAVIGTENSAPQLLFYDDFGVTDTELRTRELLYTLGTSDIPAVTTPSFRALMLHAGRIFGIHGKRLHYSTQQASLEAPYFPAGGFLEFEEPLTAIGSIEAGLVVFARRTTWLLQGAGPGPSLQPFWPTPQLLSRDIGCVSQASLLSCRHGLFFQSDRGIELLQRNGGIEQFGDPVKDELEVYPLVRKVVDADDDGQIRWLCSEFGCFPDGIATPAIWLCWDSTYQQWSTESVRGGLDCATLSSISAGVQGLMAMTREAAGGLTIYHHSGWYDDNATPSDYPSRTLTTGWIRPGGIGGWGRLRRLRLHGDTPVYATSVEGETVTVTIRQHSEAGVEVSSTHTLVVAAPEPGATAEQVLIELAPTNQQCSEFCLTIEQALPQDLDHPTIGVATSAAGNIPQIGTATLDGVPVSDGDRVLCLGQTAQATNGVWVVHAGAWTRPTDWAAGSLANANVVYVTGGTARGNTYWYDPEADVIGTDPVSFAQQYYRGGEGTSWAALSIDWEDLSNRPRTTNTLRA
jgi:hypothetical protein